MTTAYIQGMQEEYAAIDGEVAILESRQVKLQAQLEEGARRLGTTRGDRAALKRLLKQNDALPE